MLNPNYRKKKREEMGLIEEEFYAKQFEIKGDITEPLMMTWAGPLVVRLVPPHDWTPRGWHVDQEELAFIREEGDAGEGGELWIGLRKGKRIEKERPERARRR